MTEQIRRFSNNLFIHRTCVILFAILCIIVLALESLWRGIKIFFYYQRRSVELCFYEITKNFTHYFRKYSDPKLWNW